MTLTHLSYRLVFKISFTYLFCIKESKHYYYMNLNEHWDIQYNALSID